MFRSAGSGLFSDEKSAGGNEQINPWEQTVAIVNNSIPSGKVYNLVDNAVRKMRVRLQDSELQTGYLGVKEEVLRIAATLFVLLHYAGQKRMTRSRMAVLCVVVEYARVGQTIDVDEVMRFTGYGEETVLEHLAVFQNDLPPYNIPMDTLPR